MQATTPTPTPGSGAALLAGLGRADPDAFAAFYDLYFPRVYAWCLGRTADPGKAEKLTETILADTLAALEVRRGAPPLAVQALRVARRVIAAR